MRSNCFILFCFVFVLGCLHHACITCYKTCPYKSKNKIVESDELFLSPIEEEIKLEEAKLENENDLFSRGFYFRQNYHKTMERLRALEDIGCETHIIWEHEFEKFLKENKELAKQIDAHPFANYKTLNPSNYIFGGIVFLHLFIAP